MRREVFYSEAPQFDFQPASPAIVSANLDTNGSWEEETISISYSGTGYHATTGSVFYPQQSGDGASGYAMISNGKVTDVQSSEGTILAKLGNSFGRRSEHCSQTIPRNWATIGNLCLRSRFHD